MNWDQIVKKVTPHIVKIETPDGHGTGFLSLYNHDKTWCGIATAAHVVSHADGAKNSGAKNSGAKNSERRIGS
jgi:hypothetical protein